MRGNYVNKLCKLLSKLKDLSLLIMGIYALKTQGYNRKRTM